MFIITQPSPGPQPELGHAVHTISSSGPLIDTVSPSATSAFRFQVLSFTYATVPRSSRPQQVTLQHGGSESDNQIVDFNCVTPTSKRIFIPGAGVCSFDCLKNKSQVLRHSLRTLVISKFHRDEVPADYNKINLKKSAS